MSIEFMEGAIYTLIAILLGCVVGALVAVVVLGDRGDPGPGDDDPDPQSDPWDDYFVMDDDDAERWLTDHTIAESFEARLLPK